jgi:hypothetical protein
LTPKASPWRFCGTSRASKRWVAGCEIAFPKPPRTRQAQSHHHELASTETASSEAALATAAKRIPNEDPKRSTTRPETTEASAEAAKNTATANPRAPSPKPSSPRIWTASPPVRKPGSTPAVATATARSTARRPDPRFSSDPHDARRCLRRLRSIVCKIASIADKERSITKIISRSLTASRVDPGALRSRSIPPRSDNAKGPKAAVRSGRFFAGGPALVAASCR